MNPHDWKCVEESPRRGGPKLFVCAKCGRNKFQKQAPANDGCNAPDPPPKKTR